MGIKEYVILDFDLLTFEEPVYITERKHVIVIGPIRVLYDAINKTFGCRSNPLVHNDSVILRIKGREFITRKKDTYLSNVKINNTETYVTCLMVKKKNGDS